MGDARLDRMVEEHFGYEAADDVEGVLATLTDDVVHHVIGSPYGELRGKAAVRRFYEELFADLVGEHVEPVARWYGDGLLVDEAVWTGRVHDARLFGLPGRSGPVSFRLLHVFELRGDLISVEKVWPDVVAMDAQLT